MSKELVVSATRHETRIAILEDDQVVEIFYQREKEYSLAGSIHKGRVTRVLPGMQSAFVDIGLERDAFLYVSDFFEDNEEYDKVVSVVEDKVLKLGTGASLPELSSPSATALAPSDESSLPDELMAAAPGLEAVAETRPVEARPERDPRDGNRDRGGDRAGDRGGDRGGRGRRGRRRRGGRGGNNSALPDSKFYTPGRDDAPVPVAAEAAQPVADDDDDDFAVLPGESLAKYSAPEHSEPAERAATEVAPTPVYRSPAEPPPLPLEVRAKDREAAAALARQAAAAETPAVETAAIEAPAAEPVAVEPAAVEPPVAAAPEVPAVEPPSLPVAEAAPVEEPIVEAGAREPLPPIVLAHEVAEKKDDFQESVAAVAATLVEHPATPPAEPEPAVEESQVQKLEIAIEEEESLEGETASLLAAAQEGEEGAEEDEGPEPARIPTSLTAALREQGSRFPHRLSRRARRKMRGGDRPDGRPDNRNDNRGEERTEARVAETGTVEPGNAVESEVELPIQLPGESIAALSETASPATVTSPETRGEPRSEGRGEGRGEAREPRESRDSRPPRGRGERGGRDRGPRGERPERGGDRSGTDRPERTEARGERTERSVERSDQGERPDRERAAVPSISELLKEGQEIIVQIAKEPLGQKGARITSHIALPGRFLVYMPTVDHVGVSRKIPSDEERQRLKKILQTNRVGMTGGFIVRTAGDGKSEEELRADMHFLYNLWLDIRQKADKKPAPLLLHHDLDLVQRILRDQLTSSFKTIWVDNEEAYEGILRFVQRFQPALVSRCKLYTRSNPIFDEFNITAELEKALRPKVWLKSGGYIVINQTEALVAIDVNTGKYVGKSNRLEDTIVRVNTDAIKEIVRQIRLRDLGGIIVVDFIDMDERKNRQKVMQTLEESMRVDRAPYKILAFNDFGLVAITRKRVKQSLERTLCTPCAACEGAGYVKSVQTVIGEILQEAQKMAKMIEGNDVLLRVNPEVAKVLKSNRNDFLQEIEEIVGRTVMIKSDPTLHQTKFDLA